MRQPVTDAAAIAVDVARIHALRPGWASTDVASGFRPHAACEPAHGPAGSHDRLAHPGAGLRRSRSRHSQVPGQPRASRRLPRRQLKPGTVLVRDYQGQRHAVTVGREGFDWQGTSYSSLSAIARAITGTAWSGPRFFALQGRGAAAKRKRKLAGAAHKRQRSAAAGRHGSQPGTATMNDAPVQLRTVAPA